MTALFESGIGQRPCHGTQLRIGADIQRKEDILTAVDPHGGTDISVRRFQRDDFMTFLWQCAVGNDDAGTGIAVRLGDAPENLMAVIELLVQGKYEVIGPFFQDLGQLRAAGYVTFHPAFEILTNRIGFRLVGGDHAHRTLIIPYMGQIPQLVQIAQGVLIQQENHFHLVIAVENGCLDHKLANKFPDGTALTLETADIGFSQGDHNGYTADGIRCLGEPVHFFFQRIRFQLKTPGRILNGGSEGQGSRTQTKLQEIAVHISPLPQVGVHFTGSHKLLHRGVFLIQFLPFQRNGGLNLPGFLLQVLGVFFKTQLFVFLPLVVGEFGA